VRRPGAPRPTFVPLQIEQRELSEGVAPIEPRPGPGGEPYAAARVLVRLHTRPLGTVDVPLPAGERELADAVEAALGEAVRAHETRDRTEPSCMAEREAALAGAPHVTVVVPTRARPQVLTRCVDSVLACEYPGGRFDVLVADNAPPDSATRDLVDERYGGDDRVGYLVAPRPGSGSARNDGAGAARGELVAFVDDDVVADRHWLAELATRFRAAPNVSCVAGLVLPSELDTWPQQLFEEYGGMGKGFEDAVYDLGEHRPDHPMFPYNPALLGSGNNVAFRRAALLEAGGYDGALGNGTPARAGEDWELFLRLFRHGHAAAYAPGAIVHHRHRRDMDGLLGQIHDYGVGLSAALTRTVLSEPRAALEIARRLPYGAWFLLSARSPKNRHRRDGYPRELRRAELAGIARGPAAYLRSRRVYSGESSNSGG
jgi:glycosyltransferase involved in cell wall biosynthesis